MEEKESNPTTETTAPKNEEENSSSNPVTENQDVVELLTNSQNETDVLKLTENLEKILTNLSELKDVNTFITENNLNILKKINEVDNIKVNVLVCKLFVKILSDALFESIQMLE